MDSKIVLGTYRLDNKILEKLINDFYNNPDTNKLINIENIDDIENMELLETPDILFITSKDISEEMIKKIDPIRKSMVIFIVDSDINKSYIYSICNLLDPGNFPTNDIIMPFAKRIRNNKENLVNPKEGININSILLYLDLIDMWDHYTKGHCERSTMYTDSLATYMGLPKHQHDIIVKSCLIHDFGKIAVSRRILSNTERLTTEEFNNIKNHTLAIDQFLPFHQFQEVRSIIRAHHENYDGTGYPYGLTNNNIPLGSKIIRVTDSFDAMTTPRGYNRVKTLEDAKKELIKYSGTQFDPEIVHNFIDVLENDNNLITYFNVQQQLNQNEDSNYQKILKNK
jgi:HD-GYP domain-containing protein (c-di-GMP phosphodiesterase class II)